MAMDLVLLRAEKLALALAQAWVPASATALALERAMEWVQG
jgi:hypothetical protein